MRFIAAIFIATLPLLSTAQSTDSIKKKKVIFYCNPLVGGQPVTRYISLQYESQFPYTVAPKSSVPGRTSTKINLADGIRLNINKNVVMKPKAYLNLGFTYWTTAFVAANNTTDYFIKELDNTRFHSIAFTGNLFKPLDNKHFIITNLNVELNGNNKSFSNLTNENLFAGGALIFGWKKGFTRMMGIGIGRNYRFGRVIHLPVFLYNRSFNKKWGVDALLPARLNFRYAPNNNSMVLIGYELEGGQFRTNSSNTLLNNTFFQRGEIRPKVTLEQKLGKYFLFTTSVGVRLNGRFDLATSYDGEKYVAENNVGAALFANAGIHVTRINKAKKKK
jgi:hypothetical protein